MNQLGLTLRQLEYFVSTVELGTFSAAAEAFHISQTAISLAVTELERTLGVQLLVRRPAKGPALTAVGRDLMPGFRRVLLEARELEADAVGGGNDVSGTVTVGSFPTVTPYVMGRVLEGVPSRHPGLTVELVEDSVEGLQKRLRDGACDVAVLYDLGVDEDLITTPLYSCTPHLLLPASHRLAGRSSVAIEEVIDEPMIAIDLPPSLDYFLGVLGRTGHTPRIRYRAGAIETVRTLVGRGLGWSLMLHRPITDVCYDGGRVVTVSLTGVDERVDVLLARSAEVRLTARVEAFTQFCIRELPALSGVNGRAAQNSAST
jgi:DNA-binding transcriptional LysR family regulator